MKNWEIEMKAEHYKKYDNLANLLGIERLKSLVPVSKEQIQRALSEGDEYLNKWNNDPWDRKDFAVRYIAYSKKLPWSLCDTGCVLKHVARYYL